MTSAGRRPARRRRGTTMLALATAGSIALHGLAIASLVGWSPAPDEGPQVIAVGMVFAESPAESTSDEIMSQINNDQHPYENYEETLELSQATVSAPLHRPVPAFVEGTRLAPSTYQRVTDRVAPAEPSPLPEPPIYFDEGTQLAAQPADLSPALPGRRPPVPASFVSADPPRGPATTTDAAPPPPTISTETVQPAPMITTEETPSAAQPDPGAASVASTMAIEPARYVGPGLANPGPQYPRSARRRGDEGTVVVRVAVSASGVPDTVQLLSSSGFQSLDSAAVEAVRGWRFIPARRGDVAVPAMLDVPIAFRLTNN